MGDQTHFWIAPFQRARIIKTNDYPDLMGRELWVMQGKPEAVPVYDIERRRNVSDDPTYTSHLFDDQGNPVRIGADQVELLARNEHDFASYVECEYWKTWRDTGRDQS